MTACKQFTRRTADESQNVSCAAGRIRRGRWPFAFSEDGMILLVNGAFGIGKTSVARVLVGRLPGAVLYDPELLGIALQRIARLFGHGVEDFQDLRLWRRVTIAALRVFRLGFRNVVVPMAFSNAAYL